MDPNIEGQYRWDEITPARKIFWGVSLAIMFIVAITVVIYGRGVQHERTDFESVRARERENDNRRNANVAKEQSDRQAKVAAEKSDQKAFEQFATGLYSIPGLRGGGGRAYLNGKVVVLDKKEKSIDSINSSLPDEMRATRADDIGTVVWLDWGEHMTGTYTTGGGAYYYTCQVTVIDRSIPAKVGTRSFRGSAPPSTTTSSYYGQNHYGSRPDDEIIQYLKGLPRR